MALLAMRSVVDRVASGGGSRYVASTMSSGINGCVPVAAKYGEHPKRRLVVILSAQNTAYATWLHLLWSPSAALYNDCRTSKCGRSMRP